MFSGFKNEELELVKMSNKRGERVMSEEMCKLYSGTLYTL